MAGGRERRQHDRHPYYAKATVAGKLLAYIRNLSECGARLSVIRATPFPPGETLWIRAPALDADGVELVARCRVVWSKRLGPYCDIGVSFGESDPPMREKLAEFARILALRQRRQDRPADVQVEILEDHSES